MIMMRKEWISLPSPVSFLCGKEKLFEQAVKEDETYIPVYALRRNELTLQGMCTCEAREALRTYVKMLHEGFDMQLNVTMDTAIGRAFIRLWKPEREDKPFEHKMILDINCRRILEKDGSALLRVDFMWHDAFAFHACGEYAPQGGDEAHEETAQQTIVHSGQKGDAQAAP